MSLRATGPLSIGGVLDRGFKIYRAGLTRVGPIVYLSGLATGLWNWFLNGFILDSVAEGSDPTGALFSLEPLLGFLVMLLLATWFMSAAFNRTRDIARDQEGSFGTAMTVGLKRLWAVFLTAILYMLALFVSSLVFIISVAVAPTGLPWTLVLLAPALYVSVVILFCTYAAAVDNKGPVEALGYSYDIVRGNWWRSAAVFTVIMILAIVFYTVVGIVAGLFIVSEGTAAFASSQVLIDVVIMPFLSAIVGTLFYCLGFAMYDDLRLRLEGGDLAARIEGLGEA